MRKIANYFSLSSVIVFLDNLDLDVFNIYRYFFMNI